MLDDKFGTIIKLKYTHDNLQIRSIDHSFLGILELSPSQKYSPFIFLTENKRVILNK